MQQWGASMASGGPIFTSHDGRSVWSISGMIGKENMTFPRKDLPLCPKKNPHRPSWDGTQASSWKGYWFFFTVGIAFIIIFQPETDLFATQSRPRAEQIDIEDIASKPQEHRGTVGRPVVTKRKRMPSGTTSSLTQSTTLTQSWREALGPPPPLGNTKVCNSLILWMVIFKYLQDSYSTVDKCFSASIASLPPQQW
jgi:hypothetical protein